MESSPSPATLVYDVTEAEFADRVLARSATVPVVVDLWAEWCGPCRTLGPMLERAVEARGGEVELAKVDVDANGSLAQSLGVQGIPTVVGVRDGQVVSRFTGAVPAEQIEAFLDELAPSAADRLVTEAAGLDAPAAIEQLEAALAAEPGHRGAALALAERVVADEPQRALELVTAHRPDPRAEAVAARAELAAAPVSDLEALRERAAAGSAEGDELVTLGRGLAARGEHDEAIDHLLAAVATGGEARDEARAQLVSLFGILGDDDPRVPRARSRLARALY